MCTQVWIVTPLSSTSVRTPVENYSAVIPVILWTAVRSEDGLSALVGALSGVAQPRDGRQGDRPRRRVIERAVGRVGGSPPAEAGCHEIRAELPVPAAMHGRSGGGRRIRTKLGPRVAGSARSCGQCRLHRPPDAGRRETVRRAAGREAGQERRRSAAGSSPKRRNLPGLPPYKTRTPEPPCRPPDSAPTSGDAHPIRRRPRSGDHAPATTLRGTIDDRHADGAGPFVAVSGVPPVRPPCTSGTPRRAGRPRLPPWRAHSRGSAGPWVRRRRPRRGWLR